MPAGGLTRAAASHVFLLRQMEPRAAPLAHREGDPQAPRARCPKCPEARTAALTHAACRRTVQEDEEGRRSIRGFAKGTKMWEGQPCLKPSHPGKGKPMINRIVTRAPMRGEWSAIVAGTTYPSRTPREEAASSETDAAEEPSSP